MLLLVMLNYLWIAYFSFVRIEACMPPGTALAQQIPALIQVDLKLLHASMLVIIQASCFREVQEFVFLVYQPFDVLHNFFVVH
jgi:hypothetical protein